MQRPIKFSSFIVVLKEFGWEFGSTWGDRRLFTKPGRLPICVRVENGKVPDSYALHALRIALEDFFRY